VNIAIEQAFFQVDHSPVAALSKCAQKITICQELFQRFVQLGTRLGQQFAIMLRIRTDQLVKHVYIIDKSIYIILVLVDVKNGQKVCLKVQV
jgi:hypothetical protein